MTPPRLRCRITLLSIAGGANLGADPRGLHRVGDRVDVDVEVGRRVVLGRGQRADVLLVADTVSREGCYLELRDGQVLFTDISECGARINDGCPWPREHLLADGDVIEMSPFRLRFECLEHASE